MGRRPNDEKIEVVNIRMVKEPSIYSTEKIRTPDDVLRVIANELATYDREVFAVLNLKTNGQPINLNICSVGTLDASVVSPREVFKSCILSNSAAFIAIHNHPSGSRCNQKAPELFRTARCEDARPHNSRRRDRRYVQLQKRRIT